MKKILIIVLVLFSISSFAQNTWVKWNGHLFLKNGNDSVHYGEEDVFGSMPSQAKINSDVIAFTVLGCPMVAETIGQKLMYSNVSTNLVDGQIKYTALYLPKFEVLDGIRVYVRVAGSYTADNNNRVGLYSYNTNTGLLTLVASSANNATLWTSAANAGQTINFTTPYNGSPGIYVVAFIYNNSAQVTAPAISSGVALNNASMASTAYGFSNSAKLYGTSTGTDLPATINMSAITASTIPSWIAIY